MDEAMNELAFVAVGLYGNTMPPQNGAPLLAQDFGVDLMVHADAEGWLLSRAARCLGDWGEQGYAELAEALKQQ